MKEYTFKQLVERLAEIRSEDDCNRFCGDVDRSYQAGKITYKDNETFYNIINHVIRTEYSNSAV